MTSPFLSFDPFIFSIDFLFLCLFLMLFFPFFPQKNLFFTFVKNTNNAVKALFPKLLFSVSGIWTKFFSLFFLLAIINLFSLWSYVFTPTAHLLVTFSIGFLIWFTTMLLQLNLFFNRKLEHLAPQGTPIWLLFLMVIIELISQLIRPITLSVRLAANLTAGHLILSLLASLPPVTSAFLQIPLIILEVLVALVQPFVFCMLLFLYFSENYQFGSKVHYI